MIRRTIRRAAAALAVLTLAPLAAAPHARAQELPVDLDLAYAAFLYADGEALLELYLSVGLASLGFEHDGAEYAASLPLRIALRPSAVAAPAGASDAAVLSDETELRFGVPDTSAFEAGRYHVELFRYAVAPGEYTLDLTVPADGDRDELRLALDVTVPDYRPAGRALVSDIELASDVRRGAPDDDFFKNGLVVIPNPAGLYGVGQRRLFYYAEAYHVPEATDQQEYTLFTYLSESGRPQPIEGYQRRAPHAVRHPEVLVGSFDVDSLASGSYFVHLVLLDEDNEALAEQSKKFFVFNPGVERPADALADVGFETSLYAAMPEAEVEEALRHVEPIATQQELQQRAQLRDLDEKRQFLATFWQRRDTDNDPAENEARRAYYERLRYAEDRYATGFMEGYRTDRGRVLLRYGYPAQVDPRPFNENLLPHEVWTYDNIPGHGRGIFVFADREGASRYELIHSTVTGEVSLPNWEQILQR